MGSRRMWEASSNNGVKVKVGRLVQTMGSRRRWEASSNNGVKEKVGD